MMKLGMKRIAVLLSFLLCLLGSGLAFPQPVHAQDVDCPANSINNLSVWIPPTIDRSQPSNIRLTGLSSIFENKRIWLELVSTATPGPLGPQTYRISVNVDAVGNADLTQQTLSQLAADVPQGQYTIRILGGPITSQSSGGPVTTNYPICFPGFSADYVLTVQGGTDCLDLGDTCTAGQTPNLCPNAQYAFCDTSQNPARIRLPTLTQAILNGAHCEYVPTPGNVTCSQARSTMPVLCSAEILGRPNGAPATTPVGELTMCCESEVECGKAQGTEPAGETTMVPFNACRQISVPSSGSSADAQSRAATQLSKRNDCCKCMTGDQSSTFIEADQRCSGEAEAAADNSIEAAERRGIYTAVGCVSTSVTSDNGMIAQLVRIGLGLAGGLALLMILAGGFIYSTSQGDPRKANEAKELITSAVMGLLFIIFSVTLLQFIGVSILQIPGFGS